MWELGIMDKHPRGGRMNTHRWNVYTEALLGGLCGVEGDLGERRERTSD